MTDYFDGGGAPPFIGVPSLRPPFVEATRVSGREAELAALGEVLAARPGSELERLLVVVGPGGIGKTTLLAATACDAARSGRPVFWVRCRVGDTVEALTARLVAAARTLGLAADQIGAAQQAGRSLIDLVWGHLETTPGWVLVFDNLDQAAPSGAAEAVAEYGGWVRPSRAGVVLVSSRDRDPTHWGSAAELFRVEPLDDLAGGAMLRADAPQAGTRAEARALAARLGGLPLALQAAGRALGKRTASLGSFIRYQQALTDRTLHVAPEPGGQLDARDPGTARSLVGQTWELSLDQLGTEGLGLARPLLRLLALLADAPIPCALLTPTLLGQITGEQVSAAGLDAALDGLDRYGLVETPELARTCRVPTLALHPLVRETSVLLLEASTDPRLWRDALSASLITAIYVTVDAGGEGWDMARILAPHLPLITGLASEDLETFGPCRDALNALAAQLHAAGAYDAELALRHTVLHAKQRVLGVEHPDTLLSSSNLAFALLGLGEYQRAVALAQEVLGVRERVLGAEHPDTLQSSSNLAFALLGLGEYQRAVALAQEALRVRERVLGAEHPDTLASRNDLANALLGLGEYQRPAELHQQVLEVRERVLGAEHPDTLASRSNLANALVGLGEYQRAAALDRQGLEVRERVLGAEHPATLASAGNLALALQGLGEYQRAAALYQQTVEVRERVLGTEHPATLENRTNLANALIGLGECQRAAELHQRVLEVRERVLGAEHPATLASAGNLALALQGLGEYQRAAALDQQTVEVRERVLGAEHPSTLESRNNLANALYGLGEHQRSDDLHQRNLDIRERVLGAEHPDTLASRNNLANALVGLGEYQRAAALHQQTVEIFERALGAEHPTTLGSRNNLANALVGLGEYQRAAALHQLTLGVRERVLGAEHPDTLTSRNDLALVLYGLGE
ncbi:tetratricopeptide repeat protein [Pseudonocardia sp. Cha107L01]|uniref:tetratricopeptide repeat protein n=1 Tax=Pseudonocardia sp. Cha107L01 TaxID=3457576 RepID=UPI00403E6D3F